jgi:hypothetical protein
MGGERGPLADTAPARYGSPAGHERRTGERIMSQAPSATGPSSTVRFAPISGGNGVFALIAGPPRDLGAAGFVESEHAASGTATSFAADGDLDDDGFWTVVQDERAEFTTRVLVRRPADAGAFNGTVVVEWFNVTVGMDTAANLAYVGDEILRGGYAYVGVSAQQVGVQGGDAAIAMDVVGQPVGLRGTDPERYGSLHHPGDAFSYDIFTQVARALRDPGSPLGDLEPRRLLAVGESQSAFRMVTYINAIHPLAGVFDGFLVHSRGLAAAGLGAGGRASDALSGPPTRLRTDGTTPVLVVEAEGDLVAPMRFAPARQPDDDHIRLWEMAGTAHADRYSAGDIGTLLGCPAPINAGPAHYLLKSALRHLDRWVAGHGAPPIAPRIELDGDGAVVRDERGNAVGGIRTPVVDVPAATLSGDPVGDVLMCQLFGSTTTFPPARLRELYGSRDAYLAAFDASLDQAVAGGWVLPEDRAELAAEARATDFG